jgi:hypothetical protein
VSEVGGGEIESRHSRIQEDDVLNNTVYRRRRRNAEDNSTDEIETPIKNEVSTNKMSMDSTSTKNVMPIHGNVKQDKIPVTDKMLYIHCNDEEWNCTTLTCTADNVESYVDIHFDMYFVKDSIGRTDLEFNLTILESIF